jgi:hypothetical protein
MTHTGRCHPSLSRLLAPVTRSIRVNHASSPVRLARAGEARILKLNRERPHFQRRAAPRVAPGSTVSNEEIV